MWSIYNSRSPLCIKSYTIRISHVLYDITSHLTYVTSAMTRKSYPAINSNNTLYYGGIGAMATVKRIERMNESILSRKNNQFIFRGIIQANMNA